MKIRSLLSCVLLVAGWLLAAIPAVHAQQSVVEISEASCPKCSVDQWDRLEKAREQLGLESRDLAGYGISGFAARKFGFVLGKNWYPLLYQKQVQCGLQARFGWFVLDLPLPWPFSRLFTKEYDWNIFNIPRGDSYLRFEDALVTRVTKPEEVKSCGGGRGNCMEAEVHPDERLYSNMYYPRPPSFPDHSSVAVASALDSAIVCVYGPWVSEEAHGHRPEIHPLEGVWWRESGGVSMLGLLDDSNRFDDRDEYQRVEGPPVAPRWIPWSASPKSLAFRARFSFSKQEPFPSEYVITPLGIGEMVVTDSFRSSSDGPVHVLRFNDRDMIRVREETPDAELDVDFVELCQRGDSIFGFVEMVTVIDRSDVTAGAHGWHLGPRATRTPAPMEGPERKQGDNDQEPRLAYATEVVPGSLRWDATRESVVGDVFFITSSPIAEPEKVPTLAVTTSSFPGVSVHDVRRLDSAHVTGTLRNVVAGKEGRVAIEMGREEPAVVEFSSLGLALRVVRARPRNLFAVEAPREAWTTFASAAGSAIDRYPEAPGDVRGVGRWEVELEAFYVPTKGEEPLLDAQSPFSIAMTQALHSRSVSRKIKVFGAEEPLIIELVEPYASSPTTDKTQCVTRYREAGCINALMSGEAGTRELDIFMEPTAAQDYVEFRAQVAAHDRLDNFASMELQYGSLLITGRDPTVFPRRVVRSLPALAGVEVDLEALSSEPPPDDPWSVTDRRTEVAQLTQTTASMYTRDGFLDVRELRGLIRVAKRVP